MFRNGQDRSLQIGLMVCSCPPVGGAHRAPANRKRKEGLTAMANYNHKILVNYLRDIYSMELLVRKIEDDVCKTITLP